MAAFFLPLLCAATGCYDDNSTTAQRELPNVVMESVPQGLCYVGEEYEVEVPIEWNDENPGDFDFRWTIDNKVVSTERVLKHIFSGKGTFNVVFQVIERATGLTVGQTFQVTSSSKFLLGWLILSDKGGRSAIDYIHIDTRELYPDIYNLLHPDDPLGSEPVRLAEHFTQLSDQITLIQRGGPGLVELDGTTFEKVITTREEFVGEEYPYEGFNPVDVYYTNIYSSSEILITDKGEAYERQNAATAPNAFQTASYPTIPLEYPDGKGMKVTHYTFPKLTEYFLMFDGLNRRWLAMYKMSQPTIWLPPLEKLGFESTGPNIVGPDFFDFCNGMEPHLQLVYAQNCNEFQRGDLINVIKDTQTGKYYFQKTTLFYNGYRRQRVEVSNPIQYELAPGYGINDETVFMLLRGMNTRYQNSPHLFFSVGNKLYVYRQQNDRVYLFKDFGMGENTPKGKIVSIMHNPAPPTSARLQNVSVAFSDGHFYILNCTSVMEDIARGDLDPTKAEDAAKIELEHYSGLGNIKHAIFKYGRYGNWANEQENLR